MKNSLLRQNKICFFLVVISIITTGSSLVVITRFSPKVYYSLPILIFFILSFFKMILKSRGLNKNLFLYSIFLSILILISAFFNVDYSIVNFAVIGMIWTPVFLFFLIKPNDFVVAFIKTMVFISIYSIFVTYIVPAFLPNLAGYFPVKQNSGGYDVRDYIFSFHYIGLVSRNTGIFREMGVFSIFLNFALIFIFFIKNDIEKKYIVIFILIMGIFSTLSTTGLVAMALILIAYIISDVGFNFKKLLKIGGVLALIVLLLIAVIPNATSYIGDSVNKLTNRGTSYQGRMDVIISNTQAGLENPILGNGYTKAIEIAENKSNFEIYHNTSTTTSFLSFYGILFSILITFPIILFILSIDCNLFSKIILTGVVFLLINSQFLVLDSLYYILTYFFLLNYFSDGKKRRIDA